MSGSYGLFSVISSNLPRLEKPKVEVSYKKLSNGLFFKSEKKSFFKFLQRLFFLTISLGNCYLFVAMSGSEIIHTSLVVGKTLKFPFLKKGEAEIGPCFTEPAFRGRGVYPYVLKQIVETSLFTKHYLIINDKNKPSIHGANKAGFVKVGNVKKTFLSRYKTFK